MAIYELDIDDEDPAILTRKEQMLYGGSRLGMETTAIVVNDTPDYLNDCNNDGLASGIIQLGAFTTANGVVVEIILDGQVVGDITWNTSNSIQDHAAALIAEINADASGYYTEMVDFGAYVYIRFKENLAGSLAGLSLAVELDDTDAPTYIKRELTIGDCYENRTLGKKLFELSNYLGNVMEVIADRKIAHNNSGTIDYYDADVISYSDYYPFGMEMPGRGGSLADYRYAYNGMEVDHEVSGHGNSYTTQFRQYDPRLGRWKSADPLEFAYIFSSPYVYALNTPTSGFDTDGRLVIFVNGYYHTGDLPGPVDIPSPVVEKAFGTQSGMGYWDATFVQFGCKYLDEPNLKRNDVTYVDGNLGWNSTGTERYDAGYEYAKEHFTDLTSGMVAGETIKIVAHSMGCAYSEGMIKYFEERGLKVETVIHLSAADPSEFVASPNPKTIQLGYEYDAVLAYKNFGEDYMIHGVDIYGEVQTEEWPWIDAIENHAKTKSNAYETWGAVRDLDDMTFTKTDEVYIDNDITDFTIFDEYTQVYEASGNSYHNFFNVVFKSGIFYEGYKKAQNKGENDQYGKDKDSNPNNGGSKKPKAKKGGKDVPKYQGGGTYKD